MKIFNKTFGQPRKSVGDNETFVRLIQIAKEDDDMNKKLVSILSMESFQRKSALGSLVEDMRYRAAPKDFIEAIASLRDDDVAKKTMTILTSG